MLPCAALLDVAKHRSCQPTWGCYECLRYPLKRSCAGPAISRSCTGECPQDFYSDPLSYIIRSFFSPCFHDLPARGLRRTHHGSCAVLFKMWCMIFVRDPLAPWPLLPHCFWSLAGVPCGRNIVKERLSRCLCWGGVQIRLWMGFNCSQHELLGRGPNFCKLIRHPFQMLPSPVPNPRPI